MVGSELNHAEALARVTHRLSRAAMLRPVPIFLFFAVVAAGASAMADEPQPGFSQIEIHDPFSPRYVPLTPSGGFRAFGTGVGGVGYAIPAPYFPPIFYPPGVYPFINFYRPVPFLPMAPPALPLGPVVTAPQRVDRLPGGGPPLAPKVQQPAAAKQQAAIGGGFGELANDPADRPKAGKPRATNADARARSQRFIVLGDGYFAKQDYSDAYSRYKLAQQAAPDMSDGFLRQGFALVAMGRYDHAARSFKRGISLEPRWAESGFRLDQLYGAGGQAAKAAHLEALAQEGLKGPGSDLMFLLAVMLYFDGQAERAKPFFIRAQELAGADDAHLDGFLRKLVPAVVDEAPAPAEPVATGEKPAERPPQARVAPFSQLPATPVAAPRRPMPPAMAPAPGGAPGKKPTDKTGSAARDL